MRLVFPRTWRTCVLEPRVRFPYKNYGEIPRTCNPADGDAWDVFVPGYHRRLPTGRPLKIKKFLGLYVLENGNHKIAVRVDYPGFDPAWVRADIEKSCKGYTRMTGVRGVYFHNR